MSSTMVTAANFTGRNLQLNATNVFKRTFQKQLLDTDRIEAQRYTSTMVHLRLPTLISDFDTVFFSNKIF